MNIGLTIKYTKAEYQSVIKDKLAAVPDKALHITVPIVVFMLVSLVLFYFEVLDTWWGISMTAIFSIAAMFFPFIYLAMPKLSLFLARVKLQDTYYFKINEELVERNSKHGAVSIKWYDFVSVDFLSRNISLNTERGSMIIPKARLTEVEFNQIKCCAQRVVE